jgi:type I restriction enzyme S subunit
MKNSGIPAAWELVPLKELGEWSGGGTPSKAKSEYWEKGRIPWVSPKDMKTERIADSEDHITKAAVEESTAKLISAGSVLIVTRSGILSHTLPVAVTTVPVTVNQDIKALTPKEGVLPEYVAWALRSFARDILNTCSKQGTTVNSIETAALHRFKIPVAPLDHQKHIVAEIEKQFSRLDEAVANLKRVKANLKRYKAAVLKAAVEGRLVETEAELARKKSPSPLAGEGGGEGANYETGEQLLQRILETRRSQWKGKGKYKEPSAPDTTDLPELPEGWVWASWEQIGFSQNGRAFPSRDYCDEGVRLLRPGNLHESGVLVWTNENTRHMPSRYAEDNPDLIVRSGELIMNLTAQSLKDEFLGRVCRTAGGEYCLLNQRLARLTPIEVSPEFSLVVFKSKWFRRFVDDLNTGSLIQHMFTSQIATFTFPMPPPAEQQRIVAEVDRRLSLAREVETQVDANFQRAERLRQSILLAAFSGTLTSELRAYDNRTTVGAA